MSRIGAVVVSVAAGSVAACGPIVGRDPKSGDTTPRTPLPASDVTLWLRGGGATLVGPETPQGVFVLLGGRRALLDDRGGLHGERVPSPEPLVEIAEVPGPDGSTTLLARGEHTLFRLDDPLGAPVAIVRSEIELRQLGTSPGAAVLWDASSDLPRSVNVATGGVTRAALGSALPARAVLFESSRKGAAIFEGGGLAVTVDGGTTWTPVRDGEPGDRLRVTGLRSEHGRLHAFVHADGRDAAVDIDGAALGRLDEAAPTPGEPPLLRWIGRTGSDPLARAITSGVEVGPGIALAASHGLLAKVDLRSSGILELREIVDGVTEDACSIAGRPPWPWLACTLPESAHLDLYDPFGILRVHVAGAVTPGTPILVRNGATEMRSSPSGGLMLMAACRADEEGDACVRQPDGRWITFRVQADLSGRGAGPLRDGSLVFLRGLSQGDDAGEMREEHAEAQRPEAPTPRVIIADSKGAERPMGAGVTLGPNEQGMEVQGYLQEAPDGSVSFLLANGERVLSVLRGDNVEQARLLPARAARLRDGFGMAIGAGGLLTTTDAGRTWDSTKAPEPLERSLTQSQVPSDDPSWFVVGRVGTKIGDHLRIGWAPGAPPALADVANSPPALPIRAAPQRPGSEQRIACALDRPSGKILPRTGLDDASTPSVPGALRRERTFVRAVSPLAAAAVLDEEGPKAPASSPASWKLRWTDGLELTGPVHSASVAVPAGLPWGATVRAVVATGGRALATVRAGGKYFVVRAENGRRAEVVELPFEALPPPEVVFGGDKARTIAWLRGTHVIAWSVPAAPRVVATLAVRPGRLLGQPSDEGLRIALAGSDWFVWRAFPLAGASSGVISPGASLPEPLPAIDAWVDAIPFARDASRLPRCGAKPLGTRFTIAIARPRPIEVDGEIIPSARAIYDVWAQQTEACIGGLAVALPLTNAAASDGRRLEAVRVDFMNARADVAEVVPSTEGAPVRQTRQARCDLRSVP